MIASTHDRQQLMVSYTESGFALVPIPLGTKRPAHNGWNERTSAITNAAAAVSINGNVGLAHAYCTPCPTVALDLDDFIAAEAWFRQRGLDLNTLLSADDSVIIDSGRANRKKLLYRLPIATAPIRSIQYPDPDSKQMIFELRCAAQNGKTLQDVLPPSIHPDTGQPYRWGGNGHYSRLPVIPQALLDIWIEFISTQKSTARHSKQKQPCSILGTPPTRTAGLSQVHLVLLCEPETPRAIANVREMLTFIDADCPYPKYRDVVWAVASTRWSCAYELVRDWSLTAPPDRFDEGVLQTIFESFSYEGGIRYGTLIHHAREGGWNG